MCNYAECRCAECHSAESSGTECRCAECSYVEYNEPIKKLFIKSRENGLNRKILKSQNFIKDGLID